MSAHTARYLRLMFTRADRSDWRPPVLSPVARHLAEVLSNYADDTGQAFPAVDTLAERMGVTGRTVRRARAELVAAGVIAMDDGGGRHRANRYRFPVRGWLAVVHNPDTGVRVSESTTRTRVTRNPDTGVRPKYQEGPRSTSTDAVPRGAEPWRAVIDDVLAADDARRAAEGRGG